MLEQLYPLFNEKETLLGAINGICPFGHFFTLFNEVSVWPPKVSVWALLK